MTADLQNNKGFAPSVNCLSPLLDGGWPLTTTIFAAQVNVPVVSVFEDYFAASVTMPLNDLTQLKVSPTRWRLI